MPLRIPASCKGNPMMRMADATTPSQARPRGIMRPRSRSQQKNVLPMAKSVAATRLGRDSAMPVMATIAPRDPSPSRRLDASDHIQRDRENDRRDILGNRSELPPDTVEEAGHRAYADDDVEEQGEARDASGGCAIHGAFRGSSEFLPEPLIEVID